MGELILMLLLTCAVCGGIPALILEAIPKLMVSGMV